VTVSTAIQQYHVLKPLGIAFATLHDACYCTGQSVPVHEMCSSVNVVYAIHVYLVAQPPAR
jgi:hypothetical protein